MEDTSTGSNNSRAEPGDHKKMNKSKRRQLAEFLAEKRKHSEVEKSITLHDPFERSNGYITFLPRLTGYISEVSRAHSCLWDKDHPECPRRVQRSILRLYQLNLIERCVSIDRIGFSEEWILKRHTDALVDILKSCKLRTCLQLQELSAMYDAVYYTQLTFETALAAVESLLSLTQAVLFRKIRNGMALIRPPGHHAMADEANGYCFLNNVAIAAEYALSMNHIKKVLIIDYDVHHGQGVQRLFYDRDDVLYFSIHRYENGTFWPHLREGHVDHIGRGKGVGYNINIPLNTTGLTDSDYLAIILNVLLPVAYEFSPDIIFVAAGYDSCMGCPEGLMKVTPAFYGHLISMLSGLADGRTIVSLEGGYFVESLAEGVAHTMKGLLDDVIYPLAIKKVHPLVTEMINSAIYYLRGSWKCFQYMDLFTYPKGELPIDECLEIDDKTEHVTRLIYKDINYVFSPDDTYPRMTEAESRLNADQIHQLRIEYSSTADITQTVGCVYDEVLTKHNYTNPMILHIPENPKRLTYIHDTFEKFFLFDRLKKLQDEEFDSRTWIEKVHGLEYVNKILTLGNFAPRPDLYHVEFTPECLLKCTSLVLTLVKNIAEKAVRSGVAVVRPPGHHASHETAGGFCFVNNAVVAANYLIEKYNYSRILIIDFDIHHGNGTQDLTYERSDIMYISMHRYDNAAFFPFSTKGNFDQVGVGEGEGYNVNIPFNGSTKSDADYWTIWHKLVLPLAFSYDPQFVIVSAGFDAGYFDTLGMGYTVTPEMFGQFITTLKSLACGRVMLLLEGGYHFESTSLSMAMSTKALLGDPIPVPRFDAAIQPDTQETIMNVVNTHKSKWEMLRVNKKIANFACDDKEYELLQSAVADEVKANGSVTNLIQQFPGYIKY